MGRSFAPSIAEHRGADAWRAMIQPGAVAGALIRNE